MRIQRNTATFALCLTFAGTVLFGQDSKNSQQTSQVSLDQQINMLRQDLRSQRKQIVAQNMNLSDTEAEKFWPLYDQYIGDLVQINNEKYDVIKEYAQVDSLTDEQADTLAKRWLTVDDNVNALRLKYFPKFRAELSAKQTARFYQIDRRVQMLIELQLASSLPLVGGF